ncbi:unnamed protein product, partial [Ectocarpus sp. 12 AP-2014]
SFFWVNSKIRVITAAAAVGVVLSRKFKDTHYHDCYSRGGWDVQNREYKQSQSRIRVFPLKHLACGSVDRTFVKTHCSVSCARCHTVRSSESRLIAERQAPR